MNMQLRYPNYPDSPSSEGPPSPAQYASFLEVRACPLPCLPLPP
jgi:hypothetical protein